MGFITCINTPSRVTHQGFCWWMGVENHNLLPPPSKDLPPILLPMRGSDLRCSGRCQGLHGPVAFQTCCETYHERLAGLRMNEFPRAAFSEYNCQDKADQGEFIATLSNVLVLQRDTSLHDDIVGGISGQDADSLLSGYRWSTYVLLCATCSSSIRRVKNAQVFLPIFDPSPKVFLPSDDIIFIRICSC